VPKSLFAFSNAMARAADSWPMRFGSYTSHSIRKGVTTSLPTCTPARARMFAVTLLTFRLLFGKRLLYCYNWHFASCQERNRKWW